MHHPPLSAWLPWHVCLLAAVLGLLGPSRPWAAAACLAVAWLASRGLGLDRLRTPVFLACFFAGWVAASATAPAPVADPAWMLGREKVRLRGRVASVEGRPGHRLQMILQDVEVERRVGGESLDGGVVWTWDAPTRPPEVGDEVFMTGRIKPVRDFRNPGGADFESYWRLKGVAYRIYSRGETAGLVVSPGATPRSLKLRSALRERLQEALPRTQGGAMLLALLMGDRFRVDHAVVDRLRGAGLAHTMALSGLHLGYMAGLGLALAWLAGAVWPGLHLLAPRRKLAVVLALPLALVYLWLGQATPSLTRAALMLAVLAFLLLRDRDRVLLDGLFIAVGLMLAAAPQAVHDLRLQLSALAVLGIGVFLRPLLDLNPRLPGPGGWLLTAGWSVLAVSVAANLGVMPVAASVFGEVSPNIWMNVFWLPLLGAAVLPLGFAGLTLLPVPGLSAAGGWLLWASAWVMQAMLDALAWLDVRVLADPRVVLRPHWPEMAGYGLALALLAASLRSPRRMWWPGVGLALLLLTAPHAMEACRASQGVRLELLDVGQGQAALIELPGGGRVLVDAGGFHSDRFDSGRAIVGPWLARGRAPVLERAVLSHPDLDHSRGLSFLLERFQVGAVLFNGDWPEGGDRERLTSALETSGAPLETLAAGDELELGHGLVLEVLHPRRGFESADTNERSLVLRLVWEGRGLALLPGDVGLRGIRELLASERDLRAEVLVLPHHGSKGSLSVPFYQAVAPELALCSAGFLNQWGLPADRVREALAGLDIPLRVTGEEGMLRCRWPAPEARMVFEAPMARKR